ncbi:MAG: HPr(Ser) kinase/phosphatase [Thermoanaerobaculum sp.]|nr:HPr(Ser) kinase/phosphatase [Thermoanaerobaculum sp.]MDW7966960.1 HPr(Ser) kinase/phosphatase [Thermoanaerobaculum sp.]
MSQQPPLLTVRQFLAHKHLLELRLALLVKPDSGLERPILSPRLQKPGLALAGFLASLRPGRVQVIGASEADFVRTLPEEVQQERVQSLVAARPPLVVVSKGDHAAAQLFAPFCEAHGVVLGLTQATTSEVIERLSSALEVLLAPRTRIHGNLLDIFAVGVLLQGASGLGKSECALELIYRGHRLVADDVVEVFRLRQDQLIGQAPEKGRGVMEVRGLGIINIDQLFGAAAIRDWKPIDLVIQLVPEETTPLERLGVDQQVTEILGVRRPLLQVPVAAGRSLSLLVECAARRHLLLQRGIADMGRAFVEAHDHVLQRE